MSTASKTFSITVTAASSYDPATTRYVRAGAAGSANGLDWTNAFTSLPATLVRGYTYFIADGAYSSYTFDDANSGTSVITIKKATTAAHGTETGWNSTYGDGQAVFSGETFVNTNYYTFDGQTRNANWQTGATDQYGIRFQSTYNKAVNLSGSYITFRYCDCVGRGYSSGVGDDVIYAMNSSTFITFQYSAVRDSGRTMFIVRGSPADWLVEYCYLARSSSDAVTHGEICSIVAGQRFVWRYNYIHDPEGTAVWAIHNGSVGAGSSTTSNTARDWAIYGNVIWHSPSYNQEGISAVLHSAYDASQRNWTIGLRFYNNTIWNIQIGMYGSAAIRVDTGSDNIAENNVWSQCGATGSNVTCNYNTYYASPGADSGTGSETVGVQPLASPSTGNFRLAAATTAGRTLAAPYNIDPSGATRGSSGVWDRGAYEY